jgi:sec-independent protein translocase protein TatA
MFGLGPYELILIGVIIFLIFGAKRLPEIGKGLGGAVREFRQVKKDLSAQKSSSDHPPGDVEKPEEGFSSLESKMASKLVERIPGVKKAMDVKKKVDTARKLIE